MLVTDAFSRRAKNHQKQVPRNGINMSSKVIVTFNLLIISAALFFSCSRTIESNRVIKNPTNIQILKIGSEEQDAFCKAFKLNEPQIALYFSEADKITSRIIHDEYDWLPCFVRGTLKSNDSEYRWEIRAGGTAEITSVKTGEVTWYGCKNCNDLFKD